MISNIKSYLYFGGIIVNAFGLFFFHNLGNKPEKVKKANPGVVIIECPKPANLHVDVISTGFEVTWDDPIEGAPNQYGVWFEDVDDPGTLLRGEFLTEPFSGTSHIYIEDGLTPGKSYYTHVIFLPHLGTYQGCGAIDDPTLNGVTFAPLVFPNPGCDAPTNFQGIPDVQTIDVSWSIVGNTQNISGYEIKVDGNTVSTLGSTTSSYTINDLNPNQEYSIQLCYDCAVPGQPVKPECLDAILITTLDEICNPPENLALANLWPVQAEVSWSHPSDNQNIQSYKVYLDNSFRGTVSNTSTSTFIYNLNEGNSYEVKICSYCEEAGGGSTESCSILNITTSDCPAPSSQSFSNITANSYKVTWPSASLPLEAYRVYSRRQDGTGATEVIDDVNAPFSVVFNNLSPETAYISKVCSTCGDQDNQDNCTPWLTVTTLAEPNICDAPNNAVVDAGADQSICLGESVDLTATASAGTAPFTFAWETGENTATINVTPSATTTYSVGITDINGCVATDEVTVSIYTLPELSFTSSNADCGATNATATVTATGGSEPYTYLWENGWGFATVYNLGVGSHDVTVTDANSCEVFGTVTVEGSPVATVDLGPDQTVCFMDNTTITAVVATGTPPYTYQWSNGAITQAINTGQITIDRTFQVTVTDAIGCTATDEVDINRYLQVFVSIDETDASCEEANGSLTASATGTPPLTYTWNTGFVGTTLSNVGAGTYTVTATDANGCTHTRSATITTTDGASVDLGVDQAICEGTSIELNPTVSGVSTITYQWNTGSANQNLSITPTETTIYALTITDGNDCTATDSVTITVFSNPEINFTKRDVICEQPDGIISTTVSGGTPAYTYAWSTGSNESNLFGLTAGTYTLTVTDVNGCSDTASVTINSQGATTVYLGSDQSICTGESINIVATAYGTGALDYLWNTGATSSSINVNPESNATYMLTVTDALGCSGADTIEITVFDAPTVVLDKIDASCGDANGSITANPYGGNTPYSYQWSNSATTATINGLIEGTYTVTLTDTNGCSVTASTTINSTNETTVDAGGDQTVCAGENVSISAPGTGPGPYNYIWSTGATTATINVSPLNTTTYTVTLTTIDGCMATDEVTVFTNPLPFANAGQNQTICIGEQVILGDDPAGSNGASYLWSSGQTGTIGNGDNGQITVSSLATTTYSLTITDANGCSSVDQVTITIAEGLQLTATAIDGNCQDSLGSASVTVNGGISPYSYTWSNGATTSAVNGLIAGTYTVTVTAANGCNETASVTVQTTSPILLLIDAQSESTNGAADGSATVNVSGGIPPYTYLWNTGANTATINNLVSDIYEVTVTDSQGCEATEDIVIGLADGNDGNPICDSLSVTALIEEAGCENGGLASVTLTVNNAQAPITYEWSNGDSTAVVDRLIPGTYQYTVVDAGGCTKVDSIIIQDSGLDLSPVDTSICNIINYIQAIPMENNEVLFVLQGLSQSAFDNLVQSANLASANITVSYQGTQDLKTENLSLFQSGQSTDVGTWSMIIYDAVHGTNMDVFVQLQQEGACPSYCENVAVLYVDPVQDSTEIVIQENPPIELVDYECGDDFDETPPDGSTALASATVADLFFIHGFPILLTEVSGSDGTFSGEGIIPLPFNKQTVKVTFDNVSVNSNYKIYAGEVAAVSDELSNYDFTMNAVIEAGEICVEPPPAPGQNSEGIDEVTGLDEWGFDENGIHAGTGTQYDDYGFDANGNYMGTDSKFNPAGCSREGRDEDGNPCDPRPISETVQAFIDSVSTNLPSDLGNILTELIQNTQDSLNVLSIKCNGIRTTLDDLLNTLGYDRKFIFGANDEYYNKGMHQQFEKEPQPMVLNSERDTNTIALEKQHIELFHCDEAEVLLENVLTTLNNLQSGDQQELNDYIIEQMKNLEDAEADSLLSNNTAYINWLTQQIETFLENISTEDIGYLEESPTKEFETPKVLFNKYETLASTEAINLDDLSKKEQIIKELDFQFQQGFKYIDGVHRAFFLEELGKLQKEVFNEPGANLLPIKVSKYIGGYKYTILLDRIVFTPTGAALDAYLVLEDPENTGQKLVFEATNVGFGPTGMSESSRLALVSEAEIRLSNSAKLTLKGGGTNYIDWDCTGFLGMHIDADIEFCRNIITPLDPVTLEPLPDPEPYRLGFETYVYEWLDIVIGVDAEPFAVTGLENIKWELEMMYIDLSDKETPNITPPDGYASPYFTNERLSPLWRGFYMQELSATFPNEFNTSVEPTKVGVQDVLIDGCGFSGAIFAENLISIENGSAGGWPFSVEKLGVKVLHNRLAGADFSGEMNIPIFEENMDYEAVMYNSGHYKFSVNPNAEATMNLFLAEATINDNSKVDMEYKDGEFVAVATLSGQLRIQTPEDADIKLELPELSFCNFKVSNKDPYFDAGVWEVVGGESNVGFEMAGFEMDLADIAPYQGSSTKEAGLGFDISVALGDNLLQAGGSFGILGELEEINNRQKWKFKEIEVKQFSVDANIKNTVHVKGNLAFFKNDPTYGKGFHGLLSAEFKKGLNFTAQAAGQFGKVDDYNYFFVDVLVEGGGAGLTPGPISIKGFGGGVSYHMDNDYSGGSVNFGGGAPSTLPPIGTSFSGVNYTPTPNTGLGLRATAIVVTGNERLFNGTVSLEILFNAGDNGGGLQEISLRGNGHFLAAVDLSKLPVFNQADDILNLEAPPRQTPLTGYIDLSYNFNDRVFSGDLAMFLNVGNVIRGAGSNYSLCRANIHFGPDDWFINIGTPTEPCGMIIQVPGVGGIEATAYLDVGTKIPDFPGLPEEVKALASKVKSNEGLRKSGGGFMFGAALKVDVNLNLGPVKGYLNAGLGFDIMLRDYGDAICAENGEQVGINGWYAAGQMWGYLEGGVKVFGVPILEAGLAAVLQTRLPNPFWAQASFGVKVKVLFAKIRFNVAVEMGNVCTITSDDPSDLIGMELITFTNPIDGASNNLTDIQPEVHFAVPMDANFEIPDPQGNIASFQASVKSYKLRSANWGIDIPAQFKLYNNGSAARLIPTDLLPANDSLTATIVIEIKKDGQFFAEEERSFTFTTGEGFDHIPETNIAHSYPMNGMYEFFKEEYQPQEGYIQLISGQPDLLANLEAGVSNKIKLESASGAVSYQAVSYDEGQRKITFKLPGAELDNETLYQLTVVAQNGSGEETNISSPIYFRVSEFNTFKAKVDAIRAAPYSAGNYPTLSGVVIAKDLSNVEPFDDISLYGTEEIDALTTFKASLDNTWYLNQIKPLIYDVYPINTEVCGTITYADEFGVLDDPRDAAGIVGSQSDPIRISADHFSSGSFNFDPGQQYLRYIVPVMAYDHYKEVRGQIINCVQQQMMRAQQQNSYGSGGGYDGSTQIDVNSLIPSVLQTVYHTEFPTAPNGSYKVEALYKLPDGTQTSFYEIIINTNAQN